MSDGKHTPGPWAFDGDFTIHTADDVAARIAVVCTDNVDDAQVKADGHLIAAAPDLLAALKQFRTKAYNAAIGSGMDDEWATAACSLADAAIAKAQGGTE